MDSETIFEGTLHITVAFDWGEEIDLAAAAKLVPSELRQLPRRRRTPASITYSSPPLLARLSAVALTLDVVGSVTAECDLTIFDFGAVNLGFRVPFRLRAAELTRLASSLAQPEPLVEAARQIAASLNAQIASTIKNAQWSDLTEEYFVFQLRLPTGEGGLTPATLVETSSAWLAGLLRLDGSTLSPEEVAEALKRRIAYTTSDLVIIEWAAALLIDEECEETLQTIEFANAQLLEFRNLDRRVEETLAHAYSLIHPLTESRLPFWGFQSYPLRVLGDLRIDALALFGRTSSALKLVGDQYLARIYRILSDRFRLGEWSQNVQESLNEAQTVYETLREESNAARIELLEIVVILLIGLEIVLTIFRH